MILKYCSKWTVSALAGLLIFVAPNAWAAETLSGSKGNIHFPVYISPGSTGGCGKHYGEYIAARGHSAFAMTPFNWATEFTICGIAINAPSEQAAKARALQSCESGRKKWKVSTAGACGVAASK
ncbi:hypothetical protein DPM33_03915 [Mesorhizobium hawassense]|uniref:DUF4189 domain-containing protein n=1 Tax=Mesorhizobium hawassense TaxID=1209954 RepID=A0A330I118_9HYPH|nr:hypothetical protein [Mesorhizobium hawassense]RAZ93004.1 hypothetical protein DPM33_03915 [Mesorhizobium hawassense]